MSTRRPECTPEWCGSSQGTGRLTATRIDLQVPVRVTGYMRRNDSPPTGGRGASRRVKDWEYGDACVLSLSVHQTSQCPYSIAVMVGRPTDTARSWDQTKQKCDLGDYKIVKHALKLMRWTSFKLLGLILNWTRLSPWLVWHVSLT
jgi:hypothetical protein